MDDGRRLDRARDRVRAAAAGVEALGAGAARAATRGEKPGERLGWIVVVGAGIVLPILLLATLFVVSDLFVIKTTQAPAATSDQAHDPRDRPPVVVGGALPGHVGGDRERDPHPGADAGAARGAHRRRDPQLLGAAAEPEDRHAPGPDERDRALRRRGRPLPRAVRRVLRPAARAHGPLRLRRPAGEVRRLAGAAVAAGAAAASARPGGTSSCTAPARAATRSAARARTATPAPT